MKTPLGRLSRTTCGLLTTPDGPDAELVFGDNLTALHALHEDYAGKIHLAYLDPPYLTGRKHYRVTRTKDPSGVMTRTTSEAFDDRWQSLADYLNALEPRLKMVRSLLSEDGCLVLHVDSKTSHYAKILCDEIFGAECFASEVIWRYRRWPSKTKNFQRVHDVMLRYLKRAESVPRYNQLYEPLAPSTVKTWGTKRQLAITDDTGRRTHSSTTEAASKGTPLGDVWEIGIVAPVARERTGYPTQKPEALLQRWIESCSRPGDLILDPYMGSGTTLAVASRMGRRALGIDQGKEAWEVSRARLMAQGARLSERQVLPGLARAKLRNQSQKVAI